MACVRTGWAPLAIAIAFALAEGAAAASEPPSATSGALPHGVHLGHNGRYYQDACDHDYRVHCLTKRLLPGTYRPEMSSSSSGSGNFCSCTGQCGTGGSEPPSGAMMPGDVLSAYQIPPSSSSGGEIVALIEMPDPSALDDVNVYRKAYNIPALPRCGPATHGLPDPSGGTPCFAAVDEHGTPTTTASDCPANDGETGVDMDMVSAGCPDCSILLVQMTDADPTLGPAYSDVVNSVKSAIALGASATSISFGAAESPGLASGGYTQPGHLVLAAAGDSGYLNETAGANTPSYPASASDVLSVGGTTLDRSGTSYTEVVWNDGFRGGATGSGCSTAFAMPAFQSAFLSRVPNAFGACTHRAANDVSAAAEFVSDNNASGIATYDATDGWFAAVGTSAATPLLAALLTRLGLTDVVSADLGWVYANRAAFNDVTSGNDDVTGTCTDVMCQAGPGYDGPTGVGTPNGPRLTAALAASPAPQSADAGAAGGATGGSATTEDAGAAVGDGSTVTTTCAFSAGSPRPPPGFSLVALVGIAGLIVGRRRTTLG